MATMTRQPFAPLDGARLQSLTSMKNRQNAISPSSSGKRKASDSIEIDDFENVDPILFSKRPKGSDSFFSPTKDLLKPSSFVLTKSNSAPAFVNNAAAAALHITSPIKAASPRPRTFLQPKSPAARLNTTIAKSSPLSAPAGRSPTRGSKRIGILSNRRRTASPFTRVEPPAFSLASAAPFSLDAALKGTIPSYASRPSSLASTATPSITLDSLHEPETKSGWFFDIHEDTPEQEMTNLLQHSTCVLDISSDEESEQKMRRERAEGRDKENIPPADDVSQTTRAARGPAAGIDDMMIEKARDPLAQLNAADFYPLGCDEASVVIIPGDEEDGQEEHGQCVEQQQHQHHPIVEQTFEFAPQLKPDGEASVNELMGCRDEKPAKAAVLEPIEGTGESFELWESGSARDDDAETIAASSPSPVVEEAPVVC